MIRVFLHGELGKAVGRSRWLLSVKSPAEALRLIEANTGKLYRYLHTKGAEVPFRIIANGKDLKQYEEVALPFLTEGSIHFVPTLAGAGGSGGILLAIGAALLIIAAAILTFGPGGIVAAGGLSAAHLTGSAAFFASFAFSLGLSFTLAGVSSLISKSPQSNPNNTASYLLNGPVNTISQGGPIPLGYGKAIVGSQTISAGIRSTEIPV